MKNEFDIKALGQLYFLGIEVAYRDRELFLSQRKYITDLLEDAGMQDSKLANIPINVKHYIGSSPDFKKIDNGQYQHLVGKLIYLSHTKPNISYVVGVLSQFMHDPRVIHQQAARKVLAYLKGTIGMGLLYKQGESLGVQIYTDADYAGSIDDRRSTSGYGCLVGGNLVMWRSQKQKVVARPNAKAEF